MVWGGGGGELLFAMECMLVDADAGEAERSTITADYKTCPFAPQ